MPDPQNLQADLAHRERQIRAIARLTDALFSQTTVDDLLRETVAVACEVLESDAGSLQLHDPESDLLVFRCVQGPKAKELTGFSYPATQGIGGQVFRSGESLLTNKVAENAGFSSAVDEMTGYHTESMLTVPLNRFGGSPLGVVQILNSRRVFDERDLEVLEVLGAQASAAIETARLAQEAKKSEIVHVLGDISHDIKNMLTPIQTGLLTLLPVLSSMFERLDKVEADEGGVWREELKKATRSARDDYRWIIENALDSADRVQVRTRDIADAVKGEIAPPVFESSDINDIVRSVARALRPVAQGGGVQLKLALDFEIPPAQLDRKQLYNALYNLTNNAIPETPEGGTVTIFTHAPQLGGSHFEICVSDTGRGMTEEVRARLFTDRAVSTKAGGTGLGTRIVAGVVRRHHGTIEVKSEVGRGSSFTIRLPLCQTAATV